MGNLTGINWGEFLYKCVKYIKKRDKLQLTHDNVFHSFLDCLNVKSEIIQKDLSLCSGLKKNNKWKQSLTNTIKAYTHQLHQCC